MLDLTLASHRFHMVSSFIQLLVKFVVSSTDLTKLITSLGGRSHTHTGIHRHIQQYARIYDKFMYTGYNKKLDGNSTNDKTNTKIKKKNLLTNPDYTM